MKLQLWTTVNGHAEDCLGEIEVDDEQWRNAQACAGDAYELITDLAAEVGEE